MVTKGELEHIEGGVPASRYVAGHHTWRKAVSGKSSVPRWQEVGR
jgi:hypothetical protein